MKLPAVYLVVALTAQALVAGLPASTTCTVVYFVNAVLIHPNSSYRGTLYLESPTNFSSLGLNQTVRLVAARGASCASGLGCSIEVVPGSPLYAYAVFEVRTCSPDFASSLSLLREVFSNPAGALWSTWEAARLDPEQEEFLGDPPEIVRSSVKRDFEDWLRGFGWYPLVENVSRYPLVVSAYAARFVYASQYIEYEARLLPRTLEEVVESRRGDCDDMSRLLVSLLWSYGIPAVIAYGFTAIPNFSMESTIGTFEYVFRDGGPHAFVLAYVPGYGWISLDLLAGSLLTQPFVIWGLTKGVEVTRESIEDVESLHRALAGRQLMVVLSPEDPRVFDAGSLELFINSTLGLPGSASPTPPDADTGEAPGRAAAADWWLVPLATALALSVLVAVVVVALREALASRAGFGCSS